MNNIFLKSLHMQNFKGIEELHIDFTNLIHILRGMNATGKTSVYDAYTFLMFDVDSTGNNKFEVRKLDSDGNKVHHIDITVTGVISVNGEDVELTKTQVEKWTKRRGAEEAELTGNQNKYSINGFPKSEKEYKEYINSIIDEKTFRLLTNPMAFLNLDWKEQRSMLMSFIDDIPQEEIEKQIENYSLIAKDVANESIDACRKKYTHTNSELKKEQEKYLTLLEELPGMKVTIDTKALTEQRDGLMEDISQIESAFKNNPLPNVGDINEKIVLCENKMSLMASNANADRKMKLASARDILGDLQRQKSNLEYEYQTAVGAEQERKDRIDSLKNIYNDYAKSFQKLKDIKFDESSNVCQYCGQPLPKSQADQNRKKFEAEIERQKLEINRSAGKTKKDIKELESHPVDIPDKGKITELEKQIADKQAEVDSLSVEVDVTGTDKYKMYQKEIEKARLEMSQLDDAIISRKQEEHRLSELRISLNEVNDKLAEVKVNDHIDNQITETRAKLRETSQKLADSEKYIFILENYIRFIADRINERFDGLTFKLFETQLNGGVRDCCSITYEGVPYKSLNSGRRIVMGLAIIQTLQKLFDVSAPVWVDNAESINEYNIPKMDCQMVLLKVTDDEELIVS